MSGHRSDTTGYNDPLAHINADLQSVHEATGEDAALPDESWIPNICVDVKLGGVETVQRDESSDDDDDENKSLSSTKSYYRDLCVRLTTALNKRKITHREARRKNKRMKQENQRLKEEICNLRTSNI